MVDWRAYGGQAAYWLNRRYRPTVQDIVVYVDCHGYTLAAMCQVLRKAYWEVHRHSSSIQEKSKYMFFKGVPIMKATKASLHALGLSTTSEGRSCHVHPFLCGGKVGKPDRRQLSGQVLLGIGPFVDSIFGKLPCLVFSEAPRIAMCAGQSF